MSCEGLRGELGELIPRIKHPISRRHAGAFLGELERECRGRASGLNHLAVLRREGFDPGIDPTNLFDRNWMEAKRKAEDALQRYSQPYYSKQPRKRRNPNPNSTLD